jgi:lipopolysaccharide export system protein LptA
VLLARRGVRLTSDTEEQVEDESESAQIRRQAQKIILKGNLVAIVMTILVMLIP